MPRLAELVAKRLRDLREAKGMSQEALAAAAGLSRDAISRIVRGDRAPRLETLAAMAEALGQPLPRVLDFGGPTPRVAREQGRLVMLRQLDHYLASVDEHEEQRVGEIIAAICRPRMGSPPAR